MTLAFTDDQLSALLELEYLAEANPLAVFEPSPALSGFMTDTHRFVLVRAANQIGKTYQGCARLAKDMSTIPGLRCRAIGPTRSQTHDVIGGYLAQFLRPFLADGCYFIEGKGWNTGTIRLANGSTCQLKALEDHAQAHAGPPLDRILIDEVPTAKILTESLARVMRRRGSVWVTMTPVDRPIEWFKKQVEADGSMWKQYVVRYSLENCPWLTPAHVSEHLEAMESAPWQYPQRVEGAWDGVTEDRFYKGLSEDNFVALDLRNSGEWNLGLAFDHGEKAGSEVCILIAYRKQHNQGPHRPMRWHIVDEYVSDHATSIDEDAVAVLEMMSRYEVSPDEIDLVVGDINMSRSAGQAAQKVNETLEHAFATALGRKLPPFQIDDAEKHLGPYGRRLTNQLLRHNDMTIDPRCETLTYALKHWQGKATGSDGSLKHIPDALRYFLTRAARGQLAYDRLRF